jgi:cytochrome P450
MVASSFHESSRMNSNAWDLLRQVMFTDEGKRSPYVLYRQLHELGDEFVTPDGSHVVIGFDAVQDVTRSGHFKKRRPGDHQADPAFTHFTPQQLKELNDLESDTTPFLVLLDAPDHTRLRALVQRSFMPRHVEALRSSILAEIDSLLRDVDTSAPFDMCKSFAAIFAPKIVSELIGLPAEHRETVSQLTQAQVRALDPGVSFDVCVEGLKASRQQRDYIRELVNNRRAEPRDDLVTALSLASKDEISELELVRLIQILYQGGYETTAHMIGNGLTALLRNPQQFRLLRNNIDTMMRPAIEEMLRYDTAVSFSHTYAAPGARLLGRETDPGAIYLALLSAANRDPEAFDDPDSFDINRKRKGNISFGGGTHYCLGVNLAKLELELVFHALVTRFPRMTLCEPVPVRSPTFQQQSYEKVLVLLEPNQTTADQKEA